MYIVMTRIRSTEVAGAGKYVPTKPIKIEVSATFHAQVKAAAAKRGTTMKDLLTHLLRGWLANGK